MTALCLRHRNRIGNMLKAKYNRSEGQKHRASLKNTREACYKGTNDPPSSSSAHKEEFHVWFLCSCTSLAFERRFLEILERADHFYAWQLGDWLRIALARLQTYQFATQSCVDDGF